MTKESPIDRRAFLTVSTFAIGGFICVGIGAPAIPYIIGPSLKRSENQDFVRLGPVSKVELGTPTLFKVRVTKQAGWIVEEEQISIFALTDNGRDFICMSNICTHLGCRVRWIPDREQFLSPCHNGIFDKEGYVVSGPPPRPLDRYEVKVEDDQIYIGRLFRLES